MKKEMKVSGMKNLRRNAGLLKYVCAVGMLAAVAPGAVFASDVWMKPTPEELKMTSVPGYPGTPAVMLFREEITRDDLHVVQHYERIKILTEEGKERANVELRFATTEDDGYYSGDEREETDIIGRTIHSDGTIIPFTGKPYTKLLEKGENFKYRARMFTLPDVEVGSIIEYRYATRISDSVVDAPDWFIQDRIFTKTAHFAWYPTTHDLTSSEGEIGTITWFPLLPPGVTLEHHEMPATGPNGVAQKVFELTAHDVAPQPQEEFMPPVRNFTYRVMFAYSPYHTGQEFWKARGKRWSKAEDSFIGPDSALREATQTVIAGAQTQDEKLRKIYAAVMGLENTNFTRDRGQAEDKAEGLGKISTAGDVFKHGRGTSSQLTGVFVGMARAAGMKAYAMLVPDRSKRILVVGWMDFGQFDDMIAIVNVDGKDEFFDPGQRYCAYKHLAWEDTMIGGLQGLRQSDGGAEFAGTTGENYTDTKTTRVGDLTLDDRGQVQGTLTLTYTGSAALRWRQRSLSGDEESLKHGLRTSMEGMLPKAMDVKVASVESLTDYEKPLTVKFDIKGQLGTATGKRVILPGDIFLAERTATFPHEKREMPVYFDYPQTILDAVRIKYPATMTLEASPTELKEKFMDQGSYLFNSTPAANSVTMRRSLLFNAILVTVKDYPELRNFYSQMEAKDKESVVLKVAAVQSDLKTGDEKTAVGPTVVVQKNLKMADNKMPDVGVPSSVIKGYSMGNGGGSGSGGDTGAGPMHIGGSVQPPTLISQVDPEFSEKARQAKLGGTVQVYLWVDEQGNPSHIKVVRGVGMGLDEKAVEAVRQYKFKPAMQNGKPVKVDLYIDVNFQVGAARASGAN